VEKTESRRYDLKVELFKALANPMRLALLERLKERPRCVCELASELGINKSVASKHLSQLKAAGIIEDEKRGTLVEYRLLVPCVLEMADCAETNVRLNKKRRLEASAQEG